MFNLTACDPPDVVQNGLDLRKPHFVTIDHKIGIEFQYFHPVVTFIKPYLSQPSVNQIHSDIFF